jgi:hypothetical protein
VCTELCPSNDCCTVACLHSCYLSVGLHVTNVKEDLFSCFQPINVTVQKINIFDMPLYISVPLC